MVNFHDVFPVIEYTKKGQHFVWCYCWVKEWFMLDCRIVDLEMCLLISEVNQEIILDYMTCLCLLDDRIPTRPEQALQPLFKDMSNLTKLQK